MVFSLPLLLAAGALAVSVAGWLATRAARRRNDPGDFERRLEQMRRGHALSGSTGAIIGHTPRPAPEPQLEGPDPGEDEDEDDDRPPAPTLESFTAPPVGPRVYTDPELGEFTYVPEDDTWQRQEDSSRAVRWIYVEGNPDGPSEEQRRCLAAFLRDDAAIVQRASDAVRALVAQKRRPAPMITPVSVWVDAVAPGASTARGCVFFHFEGVEGLAASAATSDDWATLACELDPFEKNE